MSFPPKERESVMFMIESGPALELVKQHIDERLRVRSEVANLSKELGIERGTTNGRTGVLCTVVFPRGKAHPDFTKPDKKGRAWPKKGTEWHKRFAAQVGRASPAETIAKAFGVPLSIGYKADGGSGWRHIGNFLSECGFLYMSKDGPYAMWIPDVEAEVAASEASGYTVDEPAKSFKPVIEGCRRIEKEEWEILVLQRELEEKKKTKADAEVPA